MEISTIYYSITILMVVVALKQVINMIHTKSKIKTVKATIIDIYSVHPQSQKVYNAKVATVGYYANGKYIISDDKIKVSMNKDIGDEIIVKYYINKPEKLYKLPLDILILSLVIGCLCLALGGNIQ
ncbi:hypothetical protein PV797_09975 [Clostridiaceae bacterium M8S5]|nr:hypothetical protein PV797_09975 [Clostridiaceae bacterium M8S5]